MVEKNVFLVVLELHRHIHHCQAIFLARVARICQCKKAGRVWEPGGLEAADSTTWADNVGRCCVSRIGFEKETEKEKEKEKEKMEGGEGARGGDVVRISIEH